MRSLLVQPILAGGLCWGQVASDCKPASTNVPGAQYPCVYPDNRVAIRLAAPDAKQVQVSLGKRYDMTRGADGGRGGFDPKTSSNGVFADAAAFNKKVKVLFLGIGSVEGKSRK